MTELGLFLLPIVLLPTERVPLHIFEDRYKELIGECLEDDHEFGLLYADEAGERRIGTRARVTEVLARLDDGRMDILVEGGERFRLLERTTGRSYDTGLVAAVEDEHDPATPGIVERALGLFDRLRELTASDVDRPPEDARELSFALAARVELPAEDKLALLGDVSERSRLETVCRLLQAAVAATERVRVAAEQAAMNGRVHFE